MAREIEARFTHVRSLWEILHDGLVETIEREGDRITLVVDVDFVRNHAELPEDSRFTLMFDGVSSLDVLTWELPTTPAPAREPGMTAADYHRAVKAWRATGTYPELAGSVFLERFARAECGLDVTEALLAADPERGTVLLVFSGMLDGERWYEVAIEARELAIRERDRTLDIDAFVALGEAYWDSLDARRSTISRT